MSPEPLPSGSFGSYRPIHSHSASAGSGFGGAAHNHPARLPPSSGSAMSSPNAKLEMVEDTAPAKRSWKKWIIGIAVAVIVLAIALGVGLGVGLSKNSGGDDSDDNGGGDNDNSPPPSNGTVTTFSKSAGWQIVLSETLSIDNDTGAVITAESVSPNPTSQSNVTVYDIDMFLHQNNSVVQELRATGLDIICYFSSGSYEPGRPDSWKFKSEDMGKELDGWPGEYWLDLNSDNVREIMTNRIKIAAEMNCSAIDPDNVDGYDNENGLGLTEQDSVSFMKFLATEAANYGMATGLKNAAAIIDDVLDYVHFSVNEQCSQYGECDEFSAFPEAGKPVFHIEYPAGEDDTDKTSFDNSTVNKYCNTNAGDADDGFNTVLKYMNLSGWVQYCDGQTFVTEGQ